MNEEQNNNEQNLTTNDIQDTKSTLKDGANFAKNASTGNIFGVVKDGFKFLGNKKVRNTILIAILIPIIVIVALASSVYVIFDEVGKVIQNAYEAITNLFNVKGWLDTGVITIEDDALEEIINAIQNTGIDLKDLKLLGDVDNVDVNSPEYQEALRKYIRMFYEAQLTTETLNIKPSLAQDLINKGKYGSVYVYRAYSDNNGDPIQLEYMPYEKMEKYANENNFDIIKDKFSVNEDGSKIIIPEKVDTTVRKYSHTYDVNKKKEVEEDLVEKANRYDINPTPTVTLKEFDYKNLISQYTTPMNFYIYLAMISQNPEFVAAVTDLVKDSKIDITIFDTETTNIEEVINMATQNQKTAKLKATGEVDKDGYPQTEIKVYEEKPQIIADITITETVTTSTTLKVTHVKTWYCEQTITYKQENANQYVDTTVTNAKNNDEYKDENEPKDPNKDGKTVTWLTDQSKKVKNTNSTISYVEDNRGQVEDKTDDFIKLLDEKYKIPNSNRYEAAGKRNMVSGAEWLFQLFQNDARLQTVEQIMRYILGKYSGNDYGVDELNWDLFQIKDFATINRSGSSDQLKRYICYWEHSSPPPTNGDNYIIETDGVGHPTVGYGIDIENSGYKDEFIAAGYPTEVGGEVPISFVDALVDRKIEECRQRVEAITSGLNLKEYQKNALISRAYNYNASGFAEKYKAYWNPETDDLYEVKPDETTGDFNHSLYKQYMSKPITSKGIVLSGLITRRKSEWTLFQTGYYDVLNERHVSFSGTTVKVGNYEFPHYLQKNYTDSYGSNSNIAESGCGPTSLAMILSGLLKSPSITPSTVVADIKENWPNGSYYVEGAGSSHCIFTNESFLKKYYGVTVVATYPNEEAVVKALEEGCGVIGRETGHILAIIPVTEEEKKQGYKFRILDSARNHSGAYKSVADANKVVDGSLSFISIIKP